VGPSHDFLIECGAGGHSQDFAAGQDFSLADGDGEQQLLGLRRIDDDQLGRKPTT
jgi:hypothetical protein